MSSNTITRFTQIDKLPGSAPALGTGLPVCGVSARGSLMPFAAFGAAFAQVNDMNDMGFRRPEIRDERPTWALGAAVADAGGRGYRYAAGAGNSQQHYLTQQLHQTKLHQDWQNSATATAATAAGTVTMRAFRGLEPWRERT